MTEPRMRWRVNPFRSREVVTPPSREPVRRFHRSLPGYAPTPLRELPGLAAALGVGRLYIKDESPRFGLLAFKGLGASWAIHRLVAKGVTLTTVASATDGNHGRAVAWTARQLGLQAVIFMTTHSSETRIEAIRNEGARVELVEGTYDEAVQACAARSAVAGWQVIADVGYEGYMEIPLWITEGYSTMFGEAEEQLARGGIPQPDFVFVQAGVGGLAAAAVDHYSARAAQPTMVIVEPTDADGLLTSALSPDGTPTVSAGGQRSLMAGLNCGTVSLTAWPVLRRGVDLFLSVNDQYAEEAMRRLGLPVEGDPRVVAGESGAAGLAGLLALLGYHAFRGPREALGLGRDSVVMLINTEGATDAASYRRIVGIEP
jgi:diaminopropionate ammonia-lyase